MGVTLLSVAITRLPGVLWSAGEKGFKEGTIKIISFVKECNSIGYYLHLKSQLCAVVAYGSARGVSGLCKRNKSDGCPHFACTWLIT